MGDRWRREGGYREVLKIASPLILSMGSWSIMHFVDRMFLTWYNREALAAALPAGVLNFTIGALFLGTAGYVNTFVAQYEGAERPERVGSAVWQGIYLSIFAGLAMLLCLPLAPAIFGWTGHAPQIQALEVPYFRILCFMVGPAVMMAAVSSFFSGRGDTWTVMWVNFVAVALNVFLDYLWIFGKGGFPELGIRGAAWATVFSHFLGAVLFMILIFRGKFRRRYHTLRAWRFEIGLFRRLMRFGLPNGLQVFLEVLSFSLFILLVGRLGEIPLAATNLAFNINTLTFLPMLGLGIAVSTLVGRYLGQNRAELAERSTYSALYLSLGYVCAMASLYVVIPELLLRPFGSYADPESFAPVKETTILLLKYVAFFSVFDASHIVLSAAIKGAGDTRFVMVASLLLSWTLMVIPVYLAIAVYGWGLYVAWTFVCAYIVVAGFVFLFRFRGGKWKSMLVIEFESLKEVIPGETRII